MVLNNLLRWMWSEVECPGMVLLPVQFSHQCLKLLMKEMMDGIPWIIAGICSSIVVPRFPDWMNETSEKKNLEGFVG